MCLCFVCVFVCVYVCVCVCVCVCVYLVMEMAHFEVLCQDVQHAHHLGEDQDPVSSLFQTYKKLV